MILRKLGMPRWQLEGQSISICMSGCRGATSLLFALSDGSAGRNSVAIGGKADMGLSMDRKLISRCSRLRFPYLTAWRRGHDLQFDALKLFGKRAMRPPWMLQVPTGQ
jgi:hypothetical protein